MHALAERLHELAHGALAGSEQMRVAGARGQCEQRPAEPVGARVPVAVDESALVQRLQRAGDLALVVADELGDPEDAEPTGGDRLVGLEGLQDDDSAP